MGNLTRGEKDERWPKKRIREIVVIDSLRKRKKNTLRKGEGED